jgi:16S rRNA (uracil1498-N3)-methyltransferase
MSERFFITPQVASDAVTLTGDEARHLAAVMRARVGDEIVLFDGSGAEFLARVQALRKHAVELAIVERREVNCELPFELTLAVALPKGERQKWLVEKITELGVTRLIPIVTERGVAQPVESTLERLRRSVIEASKQCGRNRLLKIAEPQAAADLFTAASREIVRLIADPSGQPLSALAMPANASVYMAVGPEGGFTELEVGAATAAGWQPVSLGSRILRVETAAIAMAAFVGMRAS